MKIGFTATRDGLTCAQHTSLVTVLKGGTVSEWRLREAITEFHFGCCIGGDEEAADIVFGFDPRPKMVGHPPTNEKLMSRWVHYQSITMLPPEPYLIRNARIVDDAEMLIACPKGDGMEEMRSGTWATIRYAKKAKKPITIVFSDGMVEAWA